MKYLVLYEDFFSLFPANRYEDDLAVNVAISNIGKRFIQLSPYYNINEGPHGGWTIHNHDHFYTYVVKNFDKHNQIITLEVYDGKEAKLLLATLTLNSKDLKKSLLTDLKNRFNVK